MKILDTFKRSGPGVIPGLDGLRAISILCVVYAHLLWTPSFGLKFLTRFVSPAGLGVRMFFVISGFLITTILLKEKEHSGTISLRQFYYRRSLRIFPAYYVFLLCVFVLALAGFIALESSDYLYTLTYTFNLKGRQNTWWVGHTWSLAVEEQFYLLWPLAVSRLSRRSLLRVALVVVLLAPLGRVLFYASSPQAFDHWYLALPFVADPIAIGAIIALVVSYADARIRLQNFVAGQWVWFVPVVILGLESLNNRPRWFHHPLILSGLFEPLTNIGLGLFVARVALHPTSKLTKILSSSPLVTIGVLSYSLYLWQMLFISPTSPKWFGFPFNVIFAFAAAIASFLLIERPFNELRGRRDSAVPAKIFPSPGLEAS